MYDFSPSSYFTKAIKEVLLGSYSIRSTVPLTSVLFLLKSIILYKRLAPPPFRLIVILPELFLPPFLLNPKESDFSGLPFQRSDLSTKTKSL